MLTVYECDCGAGFTAQEPLAQRPGWPVADLPMAGEAAERTRLNLSH